VTIRATSAIVLALLVAVVALSTACVTATAGEAQNGKTGGGETSSTSGVSVGQPGSATGTAEAVEIASARGEADMERTIAGRHFVRRGEDWYLESDGRRFRVLPHSLSLQFRDGATEEERRDFWLSCSRSG
jgi:hypothetical protein